MNEKALEIRISQVSWQSHQAQLKAVREMVFVQEQEVPLYIEWDDMDATAQHLLVYLTEDINQEKPIGCARLLHINGVGKIGRMAVLKEFRGLGVGMAILQKAIAIHQAQHFNTIKLSAQVHAISFYQRAGFEVVSAPYQDANIVHVDMQLAQKLT